MWSFINKRKPKLQQLKEQLIKFLNKENFKNAILPALLVQCCQSSMGYQPILSVAQNYVNIDFLMAAAFISSLVSIIMIHIIRRKPLIICSVSVLIMILGLLAFNPPKTETKLAKGLFLTYIVIYVPL